MAENPDPPSSSERHYDVFISYAHADQAWVEVLAQNLNDAGLEVFFDQWEIGPGDIFVRVLERGLTRTRNGVIVVSPTALSRPWVQEEYAVLLSNAVEHRSKLIPVLYLDAEIPPFLASRQWVDFRHTDGPSYAARVAELAAVLKGERKGPPERRLGHLAPPPGTGYHPEGPIHRTLRIDGKQTELVGGAEPVAAPVGSEDHSFETRMWELDRELHRGGEEPLPAESGPAGQARAARLHHCQLEAGAALARVYLPEPVAVALRGDLVSAVEQNSSLVLGLEVAEGLHNHPWETLCAAPGEALALHPRVQLYRAVRGSGLTPALQVPGPLRILVAIGSPEAQNPRGELLDMEAELSRILDAVEPARRAGRPAHVRILEHGTVAAIAEALAAERYHVLHLSCHAGPGVLVLEDAEGGEDLVKADRFVSEALPADRGVPLVVLAGCATAVEGEGEKALPGLARGLLAAGVPAVLAMRASVSDAYATALAGALYRTLATAEDPVPLRAFAEARRAVDRAWQEGKVLRARAEWSTPVLFLRGEGAAPAEMPLYDPRAKAPEIAEPGTVRLAAGVLVRRVGEFVGRRSDQRRILHALRGSETGGVLVRGLGGVGKSTLSAQLAQKLAAEGWLVVSQFGPVDPDGILEAVGKKLLARARQLRLPEDHLIRELARDLGNPKVDAEDRLESLGEDLLEHQELLLLLDNFEDNLTPLDAETRAFGNPQLAAFLSAWLERPGKSRLLITCRYPVPLSGLAKRRLRDHPLAPLSLAESRKLIWRLPALDARTAEENERAWAGVGGHPRALEYLDALLHGGEARFEDVAVRLETAVKKKGVADPRGWLAARGDDFKAALAETVMLAADDVLLDGLLERLRPVPQAERLLLGAAVYRVPVEEPALVWQVGELPGLPREQEPDPMPEVAVPAGFEPARAALEELGLLAQVEGGTGKRRFTVHHWTATRLEERSSCEERKDCHCRAACYWRWNYVKAPLSREKDLLDLLEARHHHHQAGELGESAVVTWWLCPLLQTRDAYRREEQLIHELLGWLPECAEPEWAEPTAAFYHRLGNIAYQRSDYDQALDWYRKSLQIFEKLGSRNRAAGSYYQLGMVAQDRSEYDQALDWYRKSLQIFEDFGDLNGVASTYHQFGNVACLRGDYDQALDWYRKSLQIREQIGDRAGMAQSYGQLGMVAQNRSDYDQALDWYQKSLQIFEELGDSAGTASPCHELGNVALGRSDYDQALAWYRKSLKIFEELGNRVGMAKSYHQLGLVAQNRGEYDQALDWYKKSLQINEGIGNREGIASAYHQFGMVAQDRGEYAQALDWYRKSLQIHEEVGDREGMANSYHNLGAVVQARGDYDQALDWYQKSLQIKEGLGNRAGIASSYHQLGNLAYLRGDYAQALDWHRKSLQIHEEIGNRSGTASNISQISVLFTVCGEPEEAVFWSLRSLAIRLQLQSPQVRSNLQNLRHQRELVGDERFREILGKHLDADSLAAVWEMLESVPGDDHE